MRMFILSAAPLLLLAGCGEGSAFDKGFKDSYRKSFVEKCVTGARNSAPPGATADFPALCGCMADKLMKDASAADLVNIPDERGNAAADQCLAELGVKGPTGGTAQSRAAP